MNHDLEKRRDAFDSLFDSINLERLSKRFLCETVAKEVCNQDLYVEKRCIYRVYLKCS